MVAVQTDATFYSFAGAMTSTRVVLDAATYGDNEYGQDEYVAKQRIEERENKEIVSGIIEQINKVYAP